MVVNADRGAGNVTFKWAQILNARSLGPQEAMKGGVAGEIRNPNHLASVVDGVREIAQSLASLSAEIAEIDGLAVFPQQGVHALKVEACVGVESGTDSGGSDDLAVIVDPQSDSVRIALFRWKFDRPAIRPSDRLELELLWGWASRILVG